MLTSTCAVLQISYLVLVSGGYYFFEQEIFRLLPNPLVGIHAKCVMTRPQQSSPS